MEKSICISTLSECVLKEFVFLFSILVTFKIFEYYVRKMFTLNSNQSHKNKLVRLCFLCEKKSYAKYKSVYCSMSVLHFLCLIKVIAFIFLSVRLFVLRFPEFFLIKLHYKNCLFKNIAF